MTRMDEDPGRRRGNTKQWRGKTARLETTECPPLRDLSWGSEGQPKNLYAPNEIPGRWTYPQKGMIQWKVKV